MLRDLDIRDILLIEELSLEFQPGLNVLTGETGAGKSILLDCLGFVLGWRGRAEVVRTGAANGEVTAVFDLPQDHPARAVLDEAGIPMEDELILRRIASPDGRKRAFINDRRASGDVLRALSDCLVELHGQGDDRGLLNPRNHMEMLDSFAGHTALVDGTRSTWSALRQSERALSDAREALRTAAEDAEYLQHAVKELDQLDPQPGEEAQLDTRRRLMQAAERIREDVEKAGHAIGVGGAQGQVSDAMRWLEDAAQQAEGALDEPLSALSRALTELAEAERGVEDMLRALSADPSELERVEERLFAIRGLARKHNVLADDLGDFAADMRIRLETIDAGEGHIAALEEARAAAQEDFDAAALKLSKSRKAAAKKLDAAMGHELAPLKMERAQFSTQIQDGTAGPKGQDDVAFVAATNPGAPSGPIAKIASGGELSRFLLALKVCLAGDAGSTLIFDEIDRGVGGATADAVGRRLAGLASGGQVIVVTHSPQVAALGGHHWQVAKQVTGQETRTHVAALTEAERIDEIARMLAGENITNAARDAAKELLDG